MVLFVTDDAKFLSRMRAVLAVHSDLEISVALDGNEALSLLKTFNAKLLVIDADMDRHKWNHIIGDLYRFSHDMRVVVLLTGLAKPAIGIHELLKVGGDAIVEKGDAARILLKLIAEAMGA